MMSSHMAPSRMSFPLMRINTFPSRFSRLPNSPQDEVFSTPNGDINHPPNFATPKNKNDSLDSTQYFTPKGYNRQVSNVSSSSAEEYRTPDGSLTKTDLFPSELRKSCSSSVVEQKIKNMSTINELSDNKIVNELVSIKNEKNSRASALSDEGVVRSKSSFEIPRVASQSKSENVFHRLSQKSDNILFFWTPSLKRKSASDLRNHSTPKNSSPSNSQYKIPGSPIQKHLRSLPETRTTSLSSLRSGYAGTDLPLGQQVQRYELVYTGMNLPSFIRILKLTFSIASLL